MCENWESLIVPGSTDPFRRMLPSVLIAAVCLAPDAISGRLLFVMSATYKRSELCLFISYSTFLRSFINLNFSSKMGSYLHSVISIHRHTCFRSTVPPFNSTRLSRQSA